MRARSARFHVLQTLTSSQIAANGSVVMNVEDSRIPKGRMISRVFLRVRTDLLVAAATTLELNSADGKYALFANLFGAISASMAQHPLNATFIQSMDGGYLADSFARIGVFPESPQLFGEGQYLSKITCAKRSAVTPGMGNSSHFSTILFPVIDQRIPGTGTSLYLGSSQIDGLAVSLTFGAFGFTDLAGSAVSIPNGTGGATGVTSVDLVAESFPVPDGGSRTAYPPLISKISNGTTNSVVLNPEGGAIASAVVRIPTYTDDSLDYIMRNAVFTTAANTQESAETAMSPKLTIDGNLPADFAYRGLEHFAGLDLIGAQGTAVATAHQLRATNASTVGDAGAAPSWYHDGGVPLVWSSPDANFFDGLSVGRHNVEFPNGWSALGNRDLYVVSFPSVPGADNAKVSSLAAREAGARGGEGAWAAIRRFLGRAGA